MELTIILRLENGTKNIKKHPLNIMVLSIRTNQILSKKRLEKLVWIDTVAVV